MTDKHDARLDAISTPDAPSEPQPQPSSSAPARRTWNAPAIESSRIFHGVVLGAFTPFACGGGS